MIRRRVLTSGFDFVLQDPVQDGVASPATPGTGKSKVKRIQYFISWLTEGWRGDEWRTLAWVEGWPI